MRSSSIPGETVADSGKPPSGTLSLPTEASLIGRFVALFTPVFAIAAGWIAGLIAQVVPGAHLDQNQIVAFMAAAAVAAIGAGWKWLQGWQQHEALVARGLAAPVRPGPPSAGVTLMATALPTPAAVPDAADPATTGGAERDQ